MTDLKKRIEDSFILQGLMETFGARLLSVKDGEVQIELPYAKSLTQQQGFLHAGAVTSIADSACGYAALTKAPEGCDIVSAEFKINMLRPAIGEKFIATGTVENAGRNLTVCRGEVVAISGETRKLVALMQATMVNVRV
ncbi:PaaI family thioesterase [Emcibacter sp.]|uniref:PaaI family thioesterase n=1 Tax=Emcibacter sp. TaxID=1979954 RepID=UPI002AA790B7|nr:PaaI family thioesterase [Emcibacter sp.]